MHHTKNVCNGPNIGENFPGRGPGRRCRRRQIRRRSAGNTATGALTVIVNTGDDFEHWGLTICPDIDTVLYGLAGVNNPQTGWGRAGETWRVLAEMERLGGDAWFRLGDKDLALHLLRNNWLKSGATLTEVTDRLRRTLDIPSRILPMCNQPVRTLVHTDEGDLPFQDYFVRRRCEPTFQGLTFVGADKAHLAPEVAESLQSAAQIIICPSNPYLSVDPILSVPGLSDLVRASDAPVVAVSPIVGGRAVKGPVAKMMREMGHLKHLPLTVVEHYAGLLDGFVIDQQDRAEQTRLPLPTLTTDTIMTDLPSKAPTGSRGPAVQPVTYGKLIMFSASQSTVER